MIILDQKREVVRIIINNISIDIANQVSSTIEGDLTARDFSINSIAFLFDKKCLFDPLNGLKENVIVGRLVPAGTGNIKNKWNKKALEDDNKFLSEQEKIEPSESPVNQ